MEGEYLPHKKNLRKVPSPVTAAVVVGGLVMAYFTFHVLFAMLISGIAGFLAYHFMKGWNEE